MQQTSRRTSQYADELTMLQLREQELILELAEVVGRRTEIYRLMTGGSGGIPVKKPVLTIVNSGAKEVQRQKKAG